MTSRYLTRKETVGRKARKTWVIFYTAACSRGLHSHTRNADLHSTMNSSSSAPTTTGHIFCATKCNLPDFIGNTYSSGKFPKKMEIKTVVSTFDTRVQARCIFVLLELFFSYIFSRLLAARRPSLGEQCVSFLWSVSHSCVCAKAHERTNFGIPPICFFCVRLLLLPLPLSFPIFRVFQSLIVQCASF